MDVDYPYFFEPTRLHKYNKSALTCSIVVCVINGILQSASVNKFFYMYNVITKSILTVIKKIFYV